MKETFLFISLTLAVFTAIFFLAYTALLLVYGIVKFFIARTESTPL